LAASVAGLKLTGCRRVMRGASRIEPGRPAADPELTGVSEKKQHRPMHAGDSARIRECVCVQEKTYIRAMLIKAKNNSIEEDRSWPFFSFRGRLAGEGVRVLIRCKMF
jgi:hypothetical protein